MSEQPHDPFTGIDQFLITQKLTLMVNRYEIRHLGPDGKPGPVIAMAQQKRMAFKEQVTFYADEDRRHAVFSFKARSRMDLGAGYDVFDGSSAQIGYFKKAFAKSLIRSTWHLETSGVKATGTERSAPIAVLRRVWDLLPVVSAVPVPFLFHFDFTDDATGHPVLSSTKAMALRDRYTVILHPAPNGVRMDGRVAAAMAVALDALQSR